jgi:predicted  nucleic acid-binding Zn-ribbon protein
LSERITLNRKEFEAFLAENQTLLERSEKLVETIAALENANKQLRQELQAANESLKTLKAELTGETREGDERLRMARERTSSVLHLLNEANKRTQETGSN